MTEDRSKVVGDTEAAMRGFEVDCGYCKGTGHIYDAWPNTGYVQCGACDGAGIMRFRGNDTNIGQRWKNRLKNVKR